MAINERPGIYSSYEVSSALAGSGSASTVAVAAQAVTTSYGEAIYVGSYAKASSLFGAGSNLTEIIRLLLLNGASAIYAVPVAASATLQDYVSAFQAMVSIDEISIVTCDSHDPQIHSAIKDSILSAPENSKFRIGVVESDGDVDALSQAATDLNCERMVLTGPIASGGIPGSVAAALCGQIASATDPAIPLNGAQLYGVGGLVNSISDLEVNSLVRSGVTPLENVGGSAYVIRGVTTRCKTSGAADGTWREITTIRIVDDVILAVKNALRSRFSRTKNTLQTRGAIRTQVIIELENKKSREIIDSYDNVTVSPAADDPTVCEVAFEFTVAHGLNQIHLTAHITV